MSDAIYIGLGSNLGDREQQLLRAVEALAHIDAAAVLRRSSLYDSAALGPPQPRYLNAVVEVECSLTPQRMLVILKQIERDLGRTPSPERWSPRAADLDLLLWGDQLVADANLQIPHLGIHQRGFVLQPLVELCPQGVHPVLGVTYETLLAKLRPAQDVMLFDSARWPTTASAPAEHSE